MIHYFIVPGYGNSDTEHWQTYFETSLSNCKRIEQTSWEKPICSDWINNIENTVKNVDPSTIVLISHSMGGIAIAHWANKFKRKIKGAMIVAPPDLENPFQDLSLQSFTPIPLTTFSFPSILVASTNDHWATMERSTVFANHWGSKMVIVENGGHINTTSGFGEWQQGLEILRTLN